MPPVMTRAEYTEKVERLLEDAKSRFQQMELDQMKKGEVEARAQLARAQERFQQRRKELESQLKRARKAGEGAWSEVKDGVEAAWSELSGAIDRARAEFAGEELEEEDAEEERKTA